MGNNKQPLATKRKKGRPSLLELQKRNLRQEKSENSDYALPVSKRSRRSNLDPDLQEEDDEDDDELSGRRKEKKLKLVLKADKGSDSGESGSNINGGQSRGKREIEDVEQTEGQNLGSKATVGTTEDSGPTTPLPDKKLLLFILDRLQKKDGYGVFSEPVDPEELPDYHDIIEDPMDFKTVRKKLDSKSYRNLEEFENDIFLITTNAMRYNSAETIYYRQARAIQELARKDFENLRKESDDDEKEPKIVRRGRPPIKHIMKRIGRSLDDHSTSDLSNTPLVNGISNSIVAHNQQRKGSAFDKFSMTDGYRGYGQNKSEKNVELSGSPLKGLSVRNWKKNSVIDENRRNTYYQPLHIDREPSVLTAFDGERKQLVPVGVYTEHAYARSLARFAANLGPIGWEIASKRIERVLPQGMRSGRGWVGEPPQHYNPSSISSPSSSQPKPAEKLDKIKPPVVSMHDSENGKRLSGVMQPCRNLNGFQKESWTSFLDDEGSNSMSGFEGQWLKPPFSSSVLSQEPPEMNQEPPELALQL